MNSLSFISRQLDVLASSSSAPCTPPSTPTRERASSSTDSEGEAGYSRRDGVAPPLKRTRTWSARSFLIPSPAQTQQAHMYRQSRNSPSRTRKRSGSTPANAQFRTESSTAMLLSPTESKEDPSIILATSCFRKRSSNAHEPQTSITPSPSTSISAQSTKPFPKMRSPATSALRRTYIVRMVILAVQWLCATWDDVKRLFRHNMVHTQPIEEEPEAETSGDEKESDDDLATASCQAARAEKHKSNPSTLLVTRAPHTPSKSKSLKPSPLGQTSKLPTVKLIPPNSLPTDIERPPILDSAITLNDQVRPRSVSPSFVAVGTNAPKTPFHTQKTLVLDLDETLIHSTTRPLYPSGGGGGLMGFGGLVGYGRRGKSGHMVEVVMNGRSTLYHVYKRPFVDYFLRKVSGWYTLVIFTASMQEYADPVIDWLDAGRGIIARRFFRESCTQLPNGSYTKDLTIIEGDLSRVCLVDNSPASYDINQANGIPIEGWTHDPNDEALLDLLPVLDSLRFTSDVRRVLGLRGY